MHSFEFLRCQRMYSLSPIVVQPTGASTSNDNSGAAQLDDDQAQELASVKERARAVHEALRRRSGFVRLRSGGAFPLPIRPYYG